MLGGGKLGGTETISEKDGKLTFTGSNFPAPNFWECYDAGLADGDPASGPVWSTTGGTSIVPPQHAAIFAIINQKAGASGGQELTNPKLSAMAEANLKNLRPILKNRRKAVCGDIANKVRIGLNVGIPQRSLSNVTDGVERRPMVSGCSLGRSVVSPSKPCRIQ